jgi:CHASE2 domain-containing sensor protein
VLAPFPHFPTPEAEHIMQRKSRHYSNDSTIFQCLLCIASHAVIQWGLLLTVWHLPLLPTFINIDLMWATGLLGC